MIPEQAEARASIEHNLRRFLSSAEPEQIRLLQYAFQGIADGNLRDLSWVIGRKAGRIFIAQS